MLPLTLRGTFGGLAQVVGMLALVNVLVAVCNPTVSRAEAQNARAGVQKPLRIVAFGDSLFAGYGLRPAQAFPVQLQKALKARGHNVVITNAGVSGDTTAGGLKRLAWAVPPDTDAVILELGANDALRGIDPKLTRANLETIIARLEQRNIPILLAGMRSPANWGEHYSDDFDAIFPALAREHDLLFYPFFLDGVVLEAKLNQQDGMHPNGKGVAAIVKRMTPSVEELLERAAANRAHPPKS
jgi:acyl-CoA thioesterase-1